MNRRLRKFLDWTIGLILIGRSSFSFIGWCRHSADLARRAGAWIQQMLRRIAEVWVEAWRLRRQRRADEREAAAPSIHAEMTDEAILAKLEEDDEADWIPLEATSCEEDGR